MVWSSRKNVVEVSPVHVLGKHGVRLSEMIWKKRVSKDLAKDKNAWRYFIRTCPTHANMENRQ